jgi:pimeloyl-ACP methyl ester carboxylesterase
VIILIHGFPASSFDYHRAIKTLEAGGHPVLMFDHIGFGLSDKPQEVSISLFSSKLRVTTLQLDGIHLLSLQFIILLSSGLHNSIKSF